MEYVNLTEILRATIDPNNNERQRAEAQLDLVHNIVGFAPKLLQVVTLNDVSLPVRQAAAVCLKNMVSQAWCDQEEGVVPKYNIPEQDRARMRDVIVEAVVQVPDLLRVHLCLTLKVMLKSDFPSPWTQVVDKINMYLQNPDPCNWLGALQCLYNLIKNFVYTSIDKRGPLIEVMNFLLPVLYNIMITLQNNQSVESVLIKKQVLKCHFALIKYTLSLEIHTKEVFTKWMEVLCLVLEQPVPEHTLIIDAEDRMVLPWWKIKKWSINTLFRLFDRYGSPINSRVEYLDFSKWYLVNFTGGVLEVLLKILDQYRRKIYVSPRVLQQTLVYIEHCVNHSYSWKLLKPHMLAIIQEVLFPMLSFTDADQDNWDSNPQQYLRIKFDLFEDFLSPIIAAQTLLTSACKKRKDVVENTIALCMNVLTMPNGDPRHRDGAFHMIGTLHTVLMNKPGYKDDISTMLEQFVFPEFHSPLGHLRARAGWVVQCFSGIRFKSDNLLFQAMQLSINALLHDRDLPVKVEASIAIQMLLSSQEKAHGYLEPQIREVTTELLNVISKTENDNIANVLQKLVPMYTVQLQPMAYEITDHLATTFSSVISAEPDTDEKAITAMGLLNALETVLSALENSPEIMAQIEKTVLRRVVCYILHYRIVDYYEEVMGLLSNLSAKRISEDMWKVLEMLYIVFQRGGFNYFNDMMPVLHNYITVDTNAFLANENHILAILTMIKNVFASAREGESELYAAKLLEVIVLQCCGDVDHCLPSIAQLVFGRLAKVVNGADLRLMLMQVLVAIFYSNPFEMISVLQMMRGMFPNLYIIPNFVRQWISDGFGLMGIHDRRLCVLSMCMLLDMGLERPPIDEVIPILIPCFIHLLDGLKHAYEAQAGEAYSPSSFSAGIGLVEQDVLSSDEDDVVDMHDEYLENQMVTRMAVANSACQPDQTHIAEPFIDVDYHLEETPTECFRTPLERYQVDEFIAFKHSMEVLSEEDPALYHRLIQINDLQKKRMRALLLFADQRKALQNSKKLQRQGGYKFTVPASVPTTFKFGP